ncbi:MAG: hypothetical protein GY941_22545 [Planctomycetes bacterium]|nr:hypothetical protein [Planctomycetota bacterium]
MESLRSPYSRALGGEVNLEELRSNYENLEDDELTRLHQGGGLTDEAYSVIETEMSNRSILILTRPHPIDEQSPQPFFSSHWKGEKPLWSAYWVVGIIGINALAFLLGILANVSENIFFQPDQQPSIAASTIGLLIGIVFFAYIIFASVSILRCAKNTKHRILGLLAQLLVLPQFIVAILFPVALVVELFS